MYESAISMEQPQPDAAMECQQVSSYRRQMHPHERVGTPLLSVGAVECVSALAVETYH